MTFFLSWIICWFLCGWVQGCQLLSSAPSMSFFRLFSWGGECVSHSSFWDWKAIHSVRHTVITVQIKSHWTLFSWWVNDNWHVLIFYFLFFLKGCTDVIICTVTNTKFKNVKNWFFFFYFLFYLLDICHMQYYRVLKYYRRWVVTATSCWL